MNIKKFEAPAQEIITFDTIDCMNASNQDFTPGPNDTPPAGEGNG